MVIKSKVLVLSSRPNGFVTTENFKVQTLEVGNVSKDGEVLLQTLYLSVDPYMRGLMNEGKTYFPCYEVGKPIQGLGIAKVIESKSTSFEVGDIVSGNIKFQENILLTSENETKRLTKLDKTLCEKHGLSHFLGALGLTGLTAYFGLLDICNPREGETVLVSGAAGATGSIAGQIAKIKGCRVVAIAGGKEKVDLCKNEFGFDEVIDYKNTSTSLNDAVAKACPKGIDCYFDNVGGELLDIVIENLNYGGRISLCGAISQYNAKGGQDIYGLKNSVQLIFKSGLMKGFLIGNYKDQFPKAIQELSEWVSSGKIKAKETIYDGFEKIPEAFVGLFHGSNVGKSVIKVSNQ